MVQALQARPDYILPVLRVGQTTPSREAIAQAWTNEIDIVPDDAVRQALVAAELEPYELIVVPAEGDGIRWGVFVKNRFFLLRLESLGLAPELHMTREGRSIRVEVEHHSHLQLVDLRIHAVDERGKTLAFSPSGELVPDQSRIARSSIMLFPTGNRRIELMRIELPAETEIGELRAVLRNPSSRGELPFALASKEVTMSLRD